MKIEPRRVNGWSQQSLMPPEHLRIALTVHLSATSDSATVGIRVTDHGEGVILGMSCTPVPVDGNYTAIVEEVTGLLQAALSEHHFPF
jgi:hypothetical protein